MQDGKIVAAAEEERFTRKKHDFSFPENAINYCLREAGIEGSELDSVGFYEKPLVKFERILSSCIQTFPRSFMTFQRAMPIWMTERLRIPSLIRKKTGFQGDVVFLEHHMSHAASAFLVSPFEEAAILTVDGVGEWATASYGVGRGTEIEIIKEMNFPNSIGLLYSTVTAHLGFRVNNSEYKVMGLAAYGEPTYLDELKKIVKVHGDGSISLDMRYFDFHVGERSFSDRFIEEFGLPRVAESEVGQEHMNLASSVQKLTEEILMKMINHLHKETGLSNLCMAGGVALNSVANGIIERDGPFEDVFIQPAAGDGGGAVGTVAYIYNTLGRNKRTYVMEDAYLGPAFPIEDTEEALKKYGVSYQKFNRENLLKETAKLIYANHIIGWFQGRMEYGPRALGSRSILANPLNPEMKDILNKRVKHREEFRPFAPVAPLDEAREYFDFKHPLPFMLRVIMVKKDKQKILPSITHVNGTGRLQTIERDKNPLYYDLLKEYKKITGVPVIINTSFNIRGEPIVCTPDDAVRCFLGTGIDYLVADTFIAEKDNGN